jgi:germination protein M
LSKRLALVLIAATAAIAVGLLILVRARPDLRGRSTRPNPTRPVPGLPPATSASRPEEVRVTLFFPSSEDGLLRPEERDLPRAADPVLFARELLDAEAAGPKTAGLLAAFPEKMSTRSVFLPGSGLVVVDLNVDADWARKAGSDEEMTAVGAVVDTLLQNLAGTGSVRLLVNGNSVETLAGHIDISSPISAMRDIVGPPATATGPAAGPSGPTGVRL